MRRLPEDLWAEFGIYALSWGLWGVEPALNPGTQFPDPQSTEQLSKLSSQAKGIVTRWQ